MRKLARGGCRDCPPQPLHREDPEVFQPGHRWPLVLNLTQGGEAKSTLGRGEQPHTLLKRNLDVRFREPTAGGAVVPS